MLLYFSHFCLVFESSKRFHQSPQGKLISLLPAPLRTGWISYTTKEIRNLYLFQESQGTMTTSHFICCTDYMALLSHNRALFCPAI